MVKVYRPHLFSFGQKTKINLYNFLKISFLQRLNNFHPNLKFAHKKSKKSVNFLHVAIRINGDKFETDLYSKPTICHQFLEFNSANLIHIKNSIVYSQGLRIKRLCSSSLAFEKNLESMRS